MVLVSLFLAGFKGGTDTWEGLAVLHAKNCMNLLSYEKKSPEGKDGLFLCNQHKQIKTSLHSHVFFSVPLTLTLVLLRHTLLSTPWSVMG